MSRHVVTGMAQYEDLCLTAAVCMYAGFIVADVALGTHF